MAKDQRRAELDKIFADVEESQRTLVSRLLDEVCFLETQMAELKKLPFVRTHPNFPQLQKATPAAKQYKECSQSYMNAIRILLGLLKSVEMEAADELNKRLQEFMSI